MREWQSTERCKAIVLSATALMFSFSVAAFSQTKANSPIEHVVAPGGEVVYYIVSIPGEDSAGNPNRAIQVGRNANSSFEVLLKPRPSPDPKQNLESFSALILSPDSKTLYFQTAAWATSDAIHSLNIATKKVEYVTDGEIACVVLGGQYQGDLIVQQHRYFVQGGSYDSLYLYDPVGKLIGLVALDDNASKVCPLLGD